MTEINDGLSRRHFEKRRLVKIVVKRHDGRYDVVKTTIQKSSLDVLSHQNLIDNSQKLIQRNLKTINWMTERKKQKERKKQDGKQTN